MNDSVRSPAGKSPPFYGYFIVIFAFVIMVVQWSVFHSFGVYFKPMSAEFGWTRAMTSGAFSLASFLSGFVTAYLGWMNDRFGPRLVISVCGLFLGLGCMLMSQVQLLWQFYLFYGVIIGLAMGGSFIPLISTVTRWFRSDRGLMTGIVASGVGVGALIGPQISNGLLAHWGWRKSYLMTGIGALVVVILIAQFLKKHSGYLDQPTKATVSQPSPVAEESASLRQALGSIHFWIFCLAGFSYGYTLFSLTVHVVPHAVDLGMVPRLAAGLLSIYGGMSILGKILFGRVSDLIGANKTMLIGFAMMIVAFSGLVFSDKTGAMFLSVGGFGFFYGACTVSHSPITANLFGLGSHGLIMGAFGISVTLGGAAGPLLTGHIFDFLGSYRVAFAICAGVSLLGLLGTIGLRQNRIPLAADRDRSA